MPGGADQHYALAKPCGVGAENTYLTTVSVPDACASRASSIQFGLATS